MTVTTDEIIRRARQQIETFRLIGVGFVPVRRSSNVSASSSIAPDTASTFTRATGEEDAVQTKSQSIINSTSINEKQAALDELRARHDAECAHCTAAGSHTRTVFGEGNPDAELMFVGEAPGAEEDRTGRPFVGRAGQKLEEMIRAMGLTRESVYIGNVLKARPPDNRTPLADEVAHCSPWLAEQIRIIQPRVIVSLGGPATKLLLGIDEGITRVRGTWARYECAGMSVDVMPTFHPAYLLRNYTRETRQKVWSDMQQVMTRLGLSPAAGPV